MRYESCETFRIIFCFKGSVFCSGIVLNVGRIALRRKSGEVGKEKQDKKATNPSGVWYGEKETS